MKTEGNITPTRIAVGVDTRDYPAVKVDVLLEFDPGEDPSRDNGERYCGRKTIMVEGRRFFPTHHHQRALVLDTISRIFKDFHLDALQLGRAQERRENDG